MPRRLVAEALGTAWLVFAGCGSAVLAAGFVADGLHVGVGFVGVALSFGLAVTTMAYAVGHVSGGHFNPAVTVGLAVAGRFAWRDVPAYVLAQCAAAVAGAGVLFVIASGAPGFSASESGFATNGFGQASPGGYSLAAALVTEVVVTGFFVTVVLGATGTRAPRGFAPLAIGLALAVVHLVSIPVTNTSANPARSLGPALFVGQPATGQLWLFVVGPVLGAVLAALLHRFVTGRDEDASSLEDADAA